jgi:BirA family biotin operon repressor/biotin-[acetyl-CoA-carboxylase] ligase
MLQWLAPHAAIRLAGGMGRAARNQPRSTIALSSSASLRVKPTSPAATEPGPSCLRESADSDAPADAPVLSLRTLEQWLAASTVGEPIAAEVRERTGSTNEDLLQRARQCQPEGVQLCVAEEQTAGRGRQRRAWLARPRSALLFSLAVPLHRLPADLPAVTLAAGVALAEALAARGVAIKLKWPNDLLVDGRKLGGILCELAVDGDGRATLVVGVGINGWLTAQDRAAIGQPAVALSELVGPALLAGQREAWLAALAAALLHAVRAYTADGFAAWRPRYNALLHARGELVDVLDGGRTHASGRVGEVDAGGRLVLDTATGPRSISVGDVSLRPHAEAPEDGG